MAPSPRRPQETRWCVDELRCVRMSLDLSFDMKVITCCEIHVVLMAGLFRCQQAAD